MVEFFPFIKCEPFKCQQKQLRSRSHLNLFFLGTKLITAECRINKELSSAAAAEPKHSLEEEAEKKGVLGEGKRHQT